MALSIIVLVCTFIVSAFTSTIAIQMNGTEMLSLVCGSTTISIKAAQQVVQSQEWLFPLIVIIIMIQVICLHQLVYAPTIKPEVEKKQKTVRKGGNGSVEHATFIIGSDTYVLLKSQIPGNDSDGDDSDSSNMNYDDGFIGTSSI